MSVTLLITYLCVNFLAVHGTKRYRFACDFMRFTNVL